MPFVKRDETGNLVAVSRESGAGFEEELAKDDPAVSAFFLGVGSETHSLDATDQDFVRVLEDVVDLLIAKGLILFTELPVDAQQKIMLRQQLRSEMINTLNLIGED